MESVLLPILLFVACAAVVTVLVRITREQNRPARAEGESYLDSLKAGYAFLRGERLLRSLVGMMFVTNLFNQASAVVFIPLWVRETRKYALDNLHYGHGNFSCDVRASSIFILILKAWLALMAAAVTAGMLFFATKTLGILGMIVLGFVYIGLIPYVRMGIGNHVWNRTAIDDSAFSSAMEFRPYFGIVLLNWLLIDRRKE